MARHAKEFKLNENQLIYLTGVRDNELSDPSMRQRANALLALNDGIEINKIASSLGVTKYTIFNWRDNFLSDGIASLQNEAKSGRGGQETQQVRQQIDAYLSSCSEADLQNVTAASLSEKFHVSRYIANSILKKYSITSERQRVWNVGITDSPIPKNTDILGIYLSSQTAIMVIATSSTGSLPLMNGCLRTERKSVAIAINESQNSEVKLTVADMIRISSDYLRKSDANHRYWTCNDFFEEIMAKRSYGVQVEYTILVYSEQPIQSNALSQTLAPVQTKMYPSFVAWSEGASTMFSTLDRRGMQNKPSDFHDSLDQYQKLATDKDEPFIWMKQPLSNHPQLEKKSVSLQNEGKQTLTTIYLLKAANGKTFTSTFERKVDIPEVDKFDLESDGFYRDFDALERGIIESRGDSLKFAKQYLAACSDCKVASGVTLKERKIDAEIGQLPVKIGGTLLGGLRGKEILTSFCFIKLASVLIQDISYHKTAKLINLVTHREETDSPLVVTTSLSDQIKKTAAGIVSYLTEWTQSTLSRFGFNPKKGNLKKGSSLHPSITLPDPYAHLENITVLMEQQSEKIKEYIEYYNSTHTGELAIKHIELLSDIELPGGHFIYISPDEVEAKHQKSTRVNERKNTLGEKGGQIVQTTNVHIEVDGKWYAVTGRSIPEALKTTLAILLEKNLLENRKIIVFSDGARSIKNWTKSLFSFTNVKVIIDWKHLQKKCNEYFSMALYGGTPNKDKRGEIKREFYGRLWVGNYKEAIEYVKQLQPPPHGILKNKAKINEMVAYLERKSYGIPCYAVRRHLKLRLSSNKCEKLNDCDFSHRQKHNGMAWSHDGSNELATLSATFINKEEDNWLKEKHLTFDFHD